MSRRPPVLGPLLLVAACGARTGLGEDPERSHTNDAGREEVDCSDPDRDGDGHRRIACGGDDCDDTSLQAHPGAAEQSEWTVETVLQCSDNVHQCAFLDDLAVDAALGPIVTYSSFDERNVVHSWLALRQNHWHGEETPFRRLHAIVAQDGRIHAIADDGAAVAFAVWIDGEWQVEETRDDVSFYTVDFSTSADMTLASDGHLHAVFQCRVDSEVEVCHAERTLDGWTIDEIGPPPNLASERLDVTADGGVVRACVGTVVNIFWPDRFYELGTAGWTWRDADHCQYLAVDPSGVVHALADTGFGTATHGTDPRVGMPIEIVGDRADVSGAAADPAGRVFTIAWAGRYHGDPADGEDPPLDARNESLAILDHGHWRFDEIDEGIGPAELVLEGQSAHVAYHVFPPDGPYQLQAIRYATRTPAEGIDDDCDGRER